MSESEDMKMPSIEDHDGGTATRRTSKRRRSSGSSATLLSTSKKLKTEEKTEAQKEEEIRDELMAPGTTDLELELDASMAEAKKRFEKERDEVLALLPENVTSNFGQIGFAKWGKSFLPVLLRSPFDVSPHGPTRRDWFNAFEKLKREERLQYMVHLVYWYGVAKSSDYYSFIPTKEIVLYDDAVGKKYKNLKAKFENIIEKLATGKTSELSKTDRGMLPAAQEMIEDMAKRPEDRIRGDVGFAEIWETTTGDEVTELPVVDEAFLEEEEEDTKPASKKKKSQQKKKAKQTKKKSRPTKKKTEVETIALSLEDSKGAQILSEKEMLAAPHTGDVGSVHDFAEKESEDDARADEEFIQGALPSEDEPDEEYTESPEMKKELMALGAETIDKPAPAPKKRRKSDEKPGKPAPAAKKKHKDFATDPAKKEQRDFSRCETKYLDDMEAWRAAVAEEKIPQVLNTLRTLVDQVEDFAATFITGYDLHKLLKRSKVLLKSNNRDLTDYKKVHERMKATFETKVQAVPKDFKPRKREDAKPKKRKGELKPTKSHDEELFVAELHGSVAAPVAKKTEMGPKKARAPSSGHDASDSAVLKGEGRVSEASSKGNEPKSREMSGSGSLKQNSDVAKSSGSRSEPGSPARIKPVVIKQKTSGFNLASFQKKKTAAPAPGASSPVKKPAPEKVTKKLPAWVDGSGNFQEPTNVDGFDRLLALDFLREMATHFPTKKVNNESVSVINHESVSLSIEAAIFAWATTGLEIVDQHSKSDGDVMEERLDQYWKKIHYLVASIAGKRGGGTLMNMIADGVFSDPTELVHLSYDKLANSFEGMPVVL